MFARRLVIADGSVEVTREVDGGMQTISQKRAAITTTDLRPDDLRYPSLPNIMNKKKPIYAKTPTDLGVDVAPRDPAARRHFNTSPWTSARLRSCHSNELRSLKFGHSVERFDGDSDFSRAAGTVARFEGLVNHPSCSFCSGTSPPRLLSAFCGQTPSANSFLNWNGRPARAPEAALSIVALPKGRIHERCPALVAPATAEYGTLNS